MRLSILRKLLINKSCKILKAVFKQTVTISPILQTLERFSDANIAVSEYGLTKNSLISFIPLKITRMLTADGMLFKINLITAKI